ncbi:MAG: glycine oxidase ThiO [Actinomycetota bacterium]|nr:glycine oxidase ThiO [Actinomycetota bacterium]
MATPDVLVVGGGVIGLALAWRARTAGLSVTVVDPSPGAGASYAAAGMLAPVSEVTYGEEQLLELNLASARRYPQFVAELEDASGAGVGYRTEGTVVVALDSGDRAVLADLHAFQTRLGLDSELLTGRECKRLEPMLAPGVRAGLFVAGDHSVDNRRLAPALLTAAERSGVDVRRGRVTGLQTDGDRVTGATLDDGDQVSAGTTVLAAGCWSGEMAGLPPDALPPVRPVKGQILRLRTPTPFLTRTVRGVVAGGHVYLVPRGDGEIVVGATVEELGYDTTTTAGGVYELLRDAHALLPGITELELVECHAGLRPGSPDNAPLLGRAGPEGLVLATGHYRNGVLLTPITADAVTELLCTGALPEVARPFDPRRFDRTAVHP